MKDPSPEPPLLEERPRLALKEREAWIDAVLEADLGVAHKQCHAAKRLFDRLVGERGYEGSYSTVQRHVRGCGLASVSVVSEEHVAEVALVDAAVIYPVPGPAGPSRLKLPLREELSVLPQCAYLFQLHEQFR